MLISFRLKQHLAACGSSLKEIVQAPLSTCLTTIIIAISLTLPSFLFSVLQSIRQISGELGGKPSITVYLSDKAPAKQIQQTIQSWPTVESVSYISPKAGLKEFTQVAELKNIVSTLKKNPLPAVLVITPKTNFDTPVFLHSITNQINSWPTVTSTQLDMLWLNRLHDIATIGQRMTFLLAAFFAVGILLIVHNIVKLTIQKHQQEIHVLSLIGATESDIRRPLIYKGFFYGLLGGALASVLVTIATWWLFQPALKLVGSFSSNLHLYQPNASFMITLIIIAALFGILAAKLATHSRKIHNAL